MKTLLDSDNDDTDNKKETRYGHSYHRRKRKRRRQQQQQQQQRQQQQQQQQQQQKEKHALEMGLDTQQEPTNNTAVDHVSPFHSKNAQNRNLKATTTSHPQRKLYKKRNRSRSHNKVVGEWDENNDETDSQNSDNNIHTPCHDESEVTTSQHRLETTFEGGIISYGNMFDVTSHADGLIIYSMEIRYRDDDANDNYFSSSSDDNDNNGTVSGSGTEDKFDILLDQNVPTNDPSDEFVHVTIYTKNGTYRGYETSPKSWTIVCQTSLPRPSSSAKEEEETTKLRIPNESFTNITLYKEDRRAFYVTLNTTDLEYTKATSDNMEVGDVIVSDDYNAFDIHVGNGIPTLPFSKNDDDNDATNTNFFYYEPRIWNGAIYYEIIDHPSNGTSLVGEENNDSSSIIMQTTVITYNLCVEQHASNAWNVEEMLHGVQRGVAIVISELWFITKNDDTDAASTLAEYVDTYDLALVDTTATIMEGGVNSASDGTKLCSPQDSIDNIVTHVSVHVTTKHDSTLDSDSLTYYMLVNAKIDVVSRFDMDRYGFIARYIGLQTVESKFKLIMDGVPLGETMAETDVDYFESVTKEFLNRVFGLRKLYNNGGLLPSERRFLWWEEEKERIRRRRMDNGQRSVIHVLIVAVENHALTKNGDSVDIDLIVQGTVSPGVDVSLFHERVNSFFEFNGAVLVQLLSNGEGVPVDVNNSDSSAFQSSTYFVDIESLTAVDENTLMTSAPPTVAPSPPLPTASNDKVTKNNHFDSDGIATKIAFACLVAAVLLFIFLLHFWYRKVQQEKQGGELSTLYTGTVGAVRDTPRMSPTADRETLLAVAQNLGWDDDDISTIAPSIISDNEKGKSRFLRKILEKVGLQRNAKHNDDDIDEEFDLATKKAYASMMAKGDAPDISERYSDAAIQTYGGEGTEPPNSEEIDSCDPNLSADTPQDLPAVPPASSDYVKRMNQRQVEFIEAIDSARKRLSRSQSMNGMQRSMVHSIPTLFEESTVDGSEGPSIAMRTTMSAYPLLRRPRTQLGRRDSYPPTRKPKRHLYSTHPHRRNLVLYPDEAKLDEDHLRFHPPLCRKEILDDGSFADTQISSIGTPSVSSRSDMVFGRRTSFPPPLKPALSSRYRSTLDDYSVADSECPSMGACSTMSAPTMSKMTIKGPSRRVSFPPPSYLSQRMVYSTDEAPSNKKRLDSGRSPSTSFIPDDSSVANSESPSIGDYSTASAPSAFRRSDVGLGRQGSLSHYRRLRRRRSHLGERPVLGRRAQSNPVLSSVGKETDSLGFTYVDLDPFYFRRDLDLTRSKSLTSLSSSEQNSKVTLSTAPIRDDKDDERSCASLPSTVSKLLPRRHNFKKPPSLRETIQRAELQIALERGPCNRCLSIKKK